MLDLNLPVLSGVEACRRIKEIYNYQPFLVCSAAILDSHISALEVLGVTESLGKPYHPLELLSRIRAILADHGPKSPDDHEARTWRNDLRQAASPPAHALSGAHAFD